MSEVVINSQQSLDAYIEHLKGQFDKHKYLRVDVKTGKQRTLTQNASLHLYCGHVAEALNDGGFDFRLSLKTDIEVEWETLMVKKYMWKPIQKVMTGHESTIKAERKQYGEIYETLSRHISTRFGIFVPWPCKETLADKEAKR